MSQSNIPVLNKYSVKQDYLDIINEAHEGYLFKFESDLDFMTITIRFERWLAESNKATFVPRYVSPGTELFGMYGVNTVVVLSSDFS